MDGPSRPGWLGSLAAALALSALTACTDEGTSPPTPPPDGGVPTDGGTDAGPDAGPQPGACAPGEVELAEGGCQPAGIPEEACGVGFTPTGDGSCDVVLPSSPCSDGQMAIPGETTCRAVAPCGSDRWGSIPVDGSTQYVDAAYSGGSSDGSSDHPFTTIQEGVDAAAAGAIVAIAAGTYPADVQIQTQSVRLWGKCPAEVEVTGTVGGLPTIFISQANGTEVHDLAVAGPDSGIIIHNAEDVLVDRVWIHDTAAPALTVHDLGGGAQATLRRSLIERAQASGAETRNGAELTVEESVVRYTQPQSDIFGWGLSVVGSPTDPVVSRLVVHRSVIEGSRELGIQAFASDVEMEDSVIRDTQPSVADGSDGMGILMIPDEDPTTVQNLTLRRSIVESSHSCGVCTVNTAVDVEHVVIRDTQPQAADGRLGYGMVIASETLVEADRPAARVRSTVVERSHMAGIAFAGMDASISGTLIRDTTPEQASAQFGRGLVAELNPSTGLATRLDLSGVVIERCHEVGLVVLGSDATLSSLVVRDVEARTADQLYGRGFIVQFSGETLSTSTVSVDQSLIESVREAGFYLAGSEATVRDTVIRHTAPQETSDRYGDGVIATTLHTPEGSVPTSLELTRCRIEHNARAGIAIFGADVAIGGSIIGCNALDLAGESHENRPYELSDLGGNICGCDDTTSACQVSSTGLAPPDPLSD